jgi:hypothetical protein
MRRIFLMLLMLAGITLSGQQTTLTGDGLQAGPMSEGDLERIHAYEDTIALMGYAIVNDSLQTNRYAACKKLILTLKEALKMNNSFSYSFDRVKTVSIQYPQDSSFRIFTWQLYADKDTYRYYGAIQVNTSDLTLHPLIDRSGDIENANVEQFELTPDKWYGALYYRILETETAAGKYYLLFGFDGYRFFHKRKLIDVLSFQEGNRSLELRSFNMKHPMAR